ncbi:Rha family transcriptional regulator [Enterococcus pseudoavium]|uniref:Rha family transcriptional regulator n=1 Tax=Enterococcus pseudoavium TaxID=44007 RepID=UPI00082AEA03|nr:Rha family transcriptional regulator [Enterococcus pseudoavium]
MKELIPKNEYGIFADSHDTARVDSLYVAQYFEKKHKNVLRAIENIISVDSGVSRQFARLNFEPGSYRDAQNQKRPCYFMTRDGFMILVMGFTGKKAMRIKEFYIDLFNQMEATIKVRDDLRVEYPILTDNITLIHENPRPHHYSNEANMLNKIVTGMSAKEYKLKNGIPLDVSSIRPYLTNQEREQLDILQRIDTGLLLSVPDYHERKQKLEWYYMKKFKEV